MQGKLCAPMSMSLRVLCDENLPPAIIKELHAWGLDVARVKAGMTDQQVATMAQSEQRILITLDADFCNILAYPPQEYFGIIRIHIHPPLLATILKALKNLFDQYAGREFKGTLIILEPTTFRIWDE